MPLGWVQRRCLLLRRPVAIVPFLEDVLVPCSICIFALNGIFCFDRQGKAKQSHNGKKTKPFERITVHCLPLLAARWPFDLLTSLVCVSLSSGLRLKGMRHPGRIVATLRVHPIQMIYLFFLRRSSSSVSTAFIKIENARRKRSQRLCSAQCTHLH